MGLQLDAIGVMMLVSIGLGASPFGLMISNLGALIPVYVGLISFSYDVLALYLSKIFTNKAYYYYGLIYGVLFAISLEFYHYVFGGLEQESLWVRIILVLIAIIILDFAKYFLYNGTGPRLSTVMLIYSMTYRFRISLNISSKIVTFSMVTLGMIVSLFHSEGLFYQFSIVTIIYVMVAGYTLKTLETLNFLNLKSSTKNE